MRRFAFVATIGAGLLLGACSKTEDTAPESRLFGNPPVIQNATLVQSQNVGVATCDMTDALKGFFCQAGVGIAIDQINWTPTTFTVHYTEALMSVQTSDPDTVAGQPNDILLVGASYQKSNTGGEKFEATLVLFDDGSPTPSPFTIDAFAPAGIATDCQPTNDCTGVPTDPQVGRICSPAHYSLTSNDPVAGDNTWTRGFALVKGGAVLTNNPVVRPFTPGDKSNLAYDCIAMSRQEYPAISDVQPGQPVKFKIEVVDRAGNLTAWPQPLQAPLILPTYTCDGDECSCCWLVSANPDECRGRPGLTGPGYPNGLCIDLLGP